MTGIVAKVKPTPCKRRQSVLTTFCVTAEPYDGADWPAVISASEGWYGVRVYTDHGSEVRYLDASALNSPESPCRRTDPGRPTVPETRRPDVAAAGAGGFVVHRGATCMEAA